ncbi:MAG: relaxase domain-containing protein [Betaproteobacteria bacterium]|nr:relaxase domain-containing protein [Betaproteobacteria bacterium]
MMSLGKVVDAASAAAYYGEVDDYYFEGHAPTRWLGDGAARLGLNGEVKKNDFTALLKGEMRDGTQMRVGGDGSRRAATDLTFSAPKSVSMQALVGGDARLVDAQKRRCADLKYVEENVASYRERIGDTVVRHASNNLIVATIRHDVSRSVDPQLHTHCVVLNATETRDGQWRALDQTPLYQQQKLLGALYRSELAIEVQRLGYSVRQTHADGRFELGHIGDQQIKAFSQRSAAIESRLALDGKTRQDASAHAKEAAALSTRQAKTDINHAEVMRGWQEKSRALQVDYAPPVKAYASDANSRQAAANDSVKFAIAHLTERKSIVDEHQVLAAALGAGTGRTDIKSIRQSLSGETFSGNLLRSREGRLTTTAAQQSERELLGVEWRGRGGVVPVMNSRDAAAALRGSPLNAGQREAVKLIATSGNRVVGIQGIAGGGKTTMLDTANRLAASRGYLVVGLAPSAAAVHQLEKVRIRSQTIAAFQHTTQTGLNSKTLVIIDEAGMVGTQDMHRVLHAVEAAGARAVLVGDSRQLKAVRAGQPFAQLQDNGMTAVHMQDIVRQRDAVLKNAVELAAKGNIHQAIARLEKSIVEIDHTRDRHAAMARDFAALDPKARAATLIVAGSRSARAALNDCVRRELGLAGTGVTIAVLEGKDLTEAQIRTTRSYEQGDVIQAERNYPAIDAKRLLEKHHQRRDGYCHGDRQSS